MNRSSTPVRLWIAAAVWLGACGHAEPVGDTDGGLEEGQGCLFDWECKRGLICEGCPDDEKVCVIGCRDHDGCDTDEYFFCHEVECAECPCAPGECTYDPCYGDLCAGD